MNLAGEFVMKKLLLDYRNEMFSFQQLSHSTFIYTLTHTQFTSEIYYTYSNDTQSERFTSQACKWTFIMAFNVHAMQWL
jgi:hypothetical protein